MEKWIQKGVFFCRALKLIFHDFGSVKSFLTHGVRVVGRVRLEIRKPDGSVLASEFPNLVVNTGLYHIADQMSDQGNAAMSHMAVAAE